MKAQSTYGSTVTPRKAWTQTHNPKCWQLKMGDRGEQEVAQLERNRGNLVITGVGPVLCYSAGVLQDKEEVIETNTRLTRRWGTDMGVEREAGEGTQGRVSQGMCTAG